MQLEAPRDLVRNYVEKLAVDKEAYEKAIKDQLDEAERVGGEEYRFYGSDFVADDPATGVASGYFSPSSLHSFFKLGGYTADSLKAEIDSFRADPKNAGRFLLCADEFGQGRPGLEFADEIVATTLTKIPFKMPPAIREFNGDALSDICAKEKFDYLRSRIAAGGSLRVTFFRPVAAFWRVANNLYAHHKLYEHLRTLYELTDEGGLIFISASDGGFNLRVLRRILLVFGVNAIASKYDGQSRVLLRKQSAIAPSLPAFDEIARKAPEIMKMLLRIAK